ncbi:MAG: hypothetical protein IKK93_11930 [Campylobacter sp.]|nr:hypothetical protein [Campylobacter sp.]
MRQFLVKTSTNWADEMDLDGFVILDEKELEEATKEMADLAAEDFDAEVSIGTNEEMDIEASEVLDELNNAIELTPEEYENISRLIGTKYGFSLYDLFKNCSDLEDHYEEIEERKEEEAQQTKINARFDEVKNLFD